jgi:pyruvate dehydrogenase E2 component (dihydrolipoamide acetyltransferase)
MAIEIKMPALSPTMEEGNLAKWLVKVGDKVRAGDIMAEIETDKATMEFEAVDEGVIESIIVPAGSEGVKVGAVIALMAGEGVVAPKAGAVEAAKPVEVAVAAPMKPAPVPVQTQSASIQRVKASPLAKVIAASKGVDLSQLKGTGPNGRIVRADVEVATASSAAPRSPAPQVTTPSTAQDFSIPHEVVKLTSIRKVIARRLTESKQTVPHIYLTLDVCLDALLKMRIELNAIYAPQGVKVSVNDMIIKALGMALERVPSCNVSFAGDSMLHYKRADISVAVSIPTGLITPIIFDAGKKPLAKVSQEMAALAAKAREGKLQPHEFQGGTASLSNMGMMGIRQFDAVINPPQAMILAVGAGEERPVVRDGELSVATMMTVTGSFDHRAIDGADGAALMNAFKQLMEAPLALVA